MQCKILYIHGYKQDPSQPSRTPAILRQELPCAVIAPDFPVHPLQAVEQASEILRADKAGEIRLIVASSYGAFIAAMLPFALPRLVINPCLKPSLELPRRHPVPEEQVQLLAGMERQIFRTPGSGGSLYGLFALRDEFFSYKELFLEYAPRRILEIDDTHRLSESSIRNLLAPLLMEILEELESGASKAR
jgi:predicted esterase YcpF (UPF0227 family)